jgi:tellurium resistance protein TerD
MAINLHKGQRIDVGLKRVGVGLGWDPNPTASGVPYDLDATAFLIGGNHKLPSDEYLVFYNNPRSPDGAVESSGDDTTGGSSDGDDETLLVHLDKVNAQVQEIVFCVSIHDFAARRQNFGQIRNSFVRLYDLQTQEEIAKYELDEDFSVETAVEFGRIYRRDQAWRFEALGIGYRNGLEELVKKYSL